MPSLGTVASAMCFVAWELATDGLCAVGTSTHIHMVPAVTVVTSEFLLGEDGLRRAVDAATASAIVTDKDSMREEALSALDVDYEDLRTADDTDECGRYMVESEIADTMARDLIDEAFRDDVRLLLELGRDDDARELMRGIADAMRECDSWLAEWSPDGPSKFADHIKDAIERGDLIERFDWWRESSYLDRTMDRGRYGPAPCCTIDRPRPRCQRSPGSMRGCPCGC